MDIQTASATGSLLVSPAVSNAALVAIPVLFSALLWTFRQHHKKLTTQYRESLDLIAEQNKELVDLKSTVADLQDANKRSNERIIDLKEQIDRLFQELEKTRDDISVSHRFGSHQDYDDYATPMSAAQNEGISELLRDLESRQKPAETADENPSMTQIRQQAEFYAQHAEAAFKQADQARRQPPKRPAPDMTQSIFVPQQETDTQFDLQDYL